MKLKNTCPFDNFLAVLAVVAKEDNPALLCRLKESKIAAELTLGRVIDMILEGRINDAKDEWAGFLCDSGAPVRLEAGNIKNFYGGQMTMFVDFFNASCGFFCVSECSNGPDVCGRFRWSFQPAKPFRVASPLKGAGNDIQSQMDKFLVEKTSSRCAYQLKANLPDEILAKSFRVEELTDIDGGQIFEQVCNGERVVVERSLRPECWMLPIDVCKLKPSEVFDLSDEITVCGVAFKLRGVTVKEGDHFTAYIKNVQGWYYYCGMLEAAGKKMNHLRVQWGGVPQIAIYTP